MTVIYSPTATVRDPGFKRAVVNVERTLRADKAVASVVPPVAGVSISRDGHTAIVQAGAAKSSNGMVAAADSLKGKLHGFSTAAVRVDLIFVLAATLTLLPAVLSKLGPRVDKLSLKWVHSGEHRSPRFAAVRRGSPRGESGSGAAPSHTARSRSRS